MREEISTTHAKDLLVKALEGQNFSPKTVRAYGDDLGQFTDWLATRTAASMGGSPMRYGLRARHAYTRLKRKMQLPYSAA